MAIKILSLDGGGTRGLFYIYFLNQLEKKLKKPIRKTFDYIGGTSIGGISALMLTHPLKWFGYRNDFYIQEILDTNLHKTILSTVFSPPPPMFKSLGLLSARYSYQMDIIDDGLRNHIFGPDPFGEQSATRCMVFAHNARENQVKVFKSWKHQNYYLYTIARATSAAPTFFTPVCIEDDVFVDGALAGANNPSTFILYEAKFYNPDEEFVILSLGAGKPKVNFECEDINKGSLAQWAPKFVNIMLQASERSFEYLHGRHEFSSEPFEKKEFNLPNNTGFCGYYKSYHNLTFRFRPSFDLGLDEIDPQKLGPLKTVAEDLFKNNGEIIDELVNRLT